MPLSPEIRDLIPWERCGLELRDSKIDGLGLVTLRPIASGELVLRFGGSILPITARSSEEVLPSTAIGLSGSVILAELAGGSRDKSDFINHSCQPNMGLIDAISLVTTRDVSTEEELTVDYSFWEADRDWRLKQSCACQVSSCRRQITGRDWEFLTPSDARFRFCAPFIKRRILAYQRSRM